MDEEKLYAGKLPAGVKVSSTFEVKIYIAGSYSKAVEICAQYCNSVGLCVTVTPTEYVYTYGRESGVIIGLMNYPRFPTTLEELEKIACKLAEWHLIPGLAQGSFSVVTPSRTIWWSKRPQDH